MKDPPEETKKAHAKNLEGLTTRELVQLLFAEDPKKYPEDEWFRDLIRAEIIRRPMPGSEEKK